MPGLSPSGLADRASKASGGMPRRLSGMVGDHWLLISALLLCAVGLIMVYSASSALAEKRQLGATHFATQQSVHLLVGLLVMTVLAARPYHKLRLLAYPVLLLVLLGLILVLIPGVGHKAGGASRWLRFLGFSLQPAEFAKGAMLLYLAYSLAEHQNQVHTFWRGLAPHMGVAGLLILPILAEPDLGTSIILFVFTAIMLYVSGARLLHLGGMVLASLPFIYLLVFKVSYRLDRLTSFLHPFDDPQNTGFQIIHSFQALGMGGPLGMGLGASTQKLFYLPEPHTDFILAVLGEELGLWGVVLVLSLYMALIWRGIRVSLEAKDLFGTYLALGATLIIGLGAFVNAGVVMGLLPTKGLTLPFISYGGSSLITNLACVGILLSVAGYRGRQA